MEFWGVEVKGGEPLKVQPGFEKLIHLSQASLGEVNNVKGAKNIPLRLKIDNKDFVIGSLSAEDRAQSMFDLVFDRDFELSHDWKNGSVYFLGYIADQPDAEDESSDDLSSEGEDEYALGENHENGLVKPKAGDDKAAAGAAKAAKGIAAAAAAKAETKKEESSDSDDDEDVDVAVAASQDGDSSDDLSGEDSEDSEEGDSSEEELPNPKQTKKRPAQETPVPAKKAKSSTPDKTGNKKGQNATPFPSKAAGKTPPGNKSKQSPKSGGQFSGKSGNKSFNSKNGKGKRGGK